MRWLAFNIKNSTNTFEASSWGWNSFSRNKDYWMYKELNDAKDTVVTGTDNWNEAAQGLISAIEGKTTTLQQLIQEKLGALYLSAATALALNYIL